MAPEVITQRRNIKNKMLLLKSDNKHPQAVKNAQKEISEVA